MKIFDKFNDPLFGLKFIVSIECLFILWNISHQILFGGVLVFTGVRIVISLLGILGLIKRINPLRILLRIRYGFNILSFLVGAAVFLGKVIVLLFNAKPIHTEFSGGILLLIIFSPIIFAFSVFGFQYLKRKDVLALFVKKEPPHVAT